jgi:CelD/BcsL family acetyltransferase involved in cellulose biosynthesis
LVEWQFDHLVQGQVPFQCHVSATSFSPVIDLTDGFAAYLEKIRKNSPRFGKDIAYKMRRIEREIGHLSFTIDSHNVSALRMLINWKSDQYRRNGEVDVFARRWICDLIYRLFDTRNEHFNGLLSVLYAGEIPIAAHFGIRSGQILAHWFPAYNVQFSKRSPGLIQHLRMAEEVTTLGVKAIDMGTGAERYKQTLKSYDLPVTEGVIVRGKLSASTHQLRIAQVNRARRLIRRHSTFFRLADWILRHYGRINLSALSASVLHAGKPGKASIKDRVHDH